jgi:hypothetical protein
MAKKTIKSVVIRPIYPKAKPPIKTVIIKPIHPKTQPIKTVVIRPIHRERQSERYSAMRKRPRTSRRGGV